MSGTVGTSHSKSKAVDRSQDTIKAWCHFNQYSSVGILDSFNCSTITDTATGVFAVNFIVPMANANYTMSGTVGDWDTVITGGAPATTHVEVRSTYIWTTSAFADKNHIMIQVAGD